MAGDVDTLWNFQHDLRITPTPGHQDSRFQGPTMPQLRLKSLSAWLIWTRVVVLATPSQPGHSQAVWFQVSRVYHFNSRYSVTIDRANQNKGSTVGRMETITKEFLSVFWSYPLDQKNRFRPNRLNYK